MELLTDDEGPYLLLHLPTATDKKTSHGTGAGTTGTGTAPAAKGKGKQKTTPPTTQTNAAAGSDQKK